jgi:CxxC motif-containing protein (DUF1111 family)
MQRPNPRWYFATLALALVPAGVRVLTWAAPPVHQIESVAVEDGKMLFTHEWTKDDPLAKGGDGLGPVFNANSCVACHGKPTVGGASGNEHNVTMFTVLPTRPDEPIRTGVVHAKAVAEKYQETLALVDPALPKESQPMLVRLEGRGRGGNSAFGFRFATPARVVLSQRNTPALYGAKWIDEIPDRVILAQEKKQRLQAGLAPSSSDSLAVGRALRLPDGRIGKFGWKAQSASLLEFVQAACANELGLGNPTQAQPKPIGSPGYAPPGLDLTAEQCEHMTTFLASLPKPLERAPADAEARAHAAAGKELFGKIGCAQCHTPSLGSVEGIYSDLLLHRMGMDLQGGGFYYGDPLPIIAAGSLPAADEWRTPPLWGVADTGPYLHDGRAATLEEAIQLHGGQGARAAAAFGQLGAPQKAQIVAFLKTLRAP